jgi:hypothetical protein
MIRSPVALPLLTPRCSTYNLILSIGYQVGRATRATICSNETEKGKRESLAPPVALPPLKIGFRNRANGLRVEQPQTQKVAHPPKKPGLGCSGAKFRVLSCGQQLAPPRRRAVQGRRAAPLPHPQPNARTRSAAKFEPLAAMPDRKGAP